MDKLANSMKRLNLIIACLIVPITLLSQTKEDKLGSWWMFFGTHHLNEKYSIHYETQLRHYEIGANFFQLLPRVGLNYKIDDNSMVTAGYAWIPTQPVLGEGFEGDLVTENRTWQQFILRNKIKNINFRHRYRLEQRWVKQNNFTDYKNRVRYMLSAKVPLSKNENSPLFLFIYDEVFLHIDDNPFNQNRLYAALGYTVNKNMNIQAGYLRHRNGDLNLNRLQLAVFLNTGN
ncbi:MAG: DUF2490 domain-containing protein [Bacteroidota bacterium]|nr:DUF2490 domain-containing protein [Bacteroidota bacterium]